jgi:hypothetical protein
MAISGAALNPGQGYHSSPPVAFLMTLFDARLGWWIGNPRNSETCTRPGPKIALWPLIRELFGELDERSPYLNLSDGGNFDNLGLYELVRRRCRFIIAVDAEEDHNFEFGALGAAVRKCRDDFQVEIDINPCPIRPSGDFSTAHCALGRIRYPGCAEFGYLLYIKASVTGDEPADVELYRRQFPEFPHQSTLDQFFTESQFESYRKLGLHCVESVFDFKLDENLHDVFERVADRWELPPAAPAGATSRQADAYTKLLDEWRKTDAVESFDSDLLESSASLFGEPKGRARHFLILDLLQLMETVFGECGLGRRENQLHRAYAGQMHVMRYWAGRTTFQEVWKTQRNNYAPAFQRFINDLMREAQTTPTNQNGNITTTDKE